MGEDTHPTMTYPTEEQYARWERRAEEHDMSMSEWVECMVEAGLKKFDATVQPDESVRELREQRNDLKAELRTARNRIEQLEDELHHGERGVIRDYVAANPGADYADIVQHVIDTAPSRIVDRLDALEGDVIRYEDGGYYPLNDGEGGGE